MILICPDCGGELRHFPSAYNCQGLSLCAPVYRRDIKAPEGLLSGVVDRVFTELCYHPDCRSNETSRNRDCGMLMGSIFSSHTAH